MSYLLYLHANEGCVALCDVCNILCGCVHECLDKGLTKVHFSHYVILMIMVKSSLNA